MYKVVFCLMSKKLTSVDVAISAYETESVVDDLSIDGKAPASHTTDRSINHRYFKFVLDITSM